MAPIERVESRFGVGLVAAEKKARRHLAEQGGGPPSGELEVDSRHGLDGAEAHDQTMNVNRGGRLGHGSIVRWHLPV